MSNEKLNLLIIIIIILIILSELNTKVKERLQSIQFTLPDTFNNHTKIERINLKAWQSYYITFNY